MAASATLALKAGVWFRRGRLFIVSPDSLAQRARCQAETPLIVLFRFLRPALYSGRCFISARSTTANARPGAGWSIQTAQLAVTSHRPDVPIDGCALAGRA